MITKMTRYDFILLSGESEAFLHKLQELGVVDITRSVKAVDEKSSSMITSAEELKARIGWLEKRDYQKDARYAELSAALKEWEKEKEERSHWGAFDANSIEKLEQDGTKLHFYRCTAKKFEEGWKDGWALEVIDSNASLVWFVIAGDNSGFPLNEIAAPAGDADAAEYEISGLRGKLAERQAELDRDLADIATLKAGYRSKLDEIDYYLASAASEEAAEGSLTVMTGFSPSADNDKLCAAFDSMGILYISQSATVEDNPPIKLKNNKFVSMFEVLTDMYGRPSYDGFDPTPFISIFFLLFFAMCIGDAGYGLLLVIIGLLLRKSGGFANLAPLVITLGLGTAVVGFFFHTFFSVDISQWNCIPESVRNIMVPAKVGTYDGTMILALIVGIIHLCLAMTVKTIHETKNKGFAASLETWGWTLLIVGGVIVGTIALAGVIDSTVTKIVIIGLGIVSGLCIFLLNDLHRNPLKNIGAGLWATYNTATGVLGDVLSYLRLYALGLAGGMLGFAFNNLAAMAKGDGGFGWIPFIVILLVGHALNVAMAALGAFVHPLRLNFLEFFKNSGYEGSGRNYNPLKNNN